MKSIRMIMSMRLSAEDIVLSTLDEVIKAYDRRAWTMKGKRRHKLFDVCQLLVGLQTEILYKRITSEKTQEKEREDL